MTDVEVVNILRLAKRVNLFRVPKLFLFCVLNDITSVKACEADRSYSIRF